MVIDSHVHLYPQEVFSDPGAWGDAHREHWWKHSVAPPGLRTLQGWATVDVLLRDMDAAGVDRVVLQGWYWENQSTATQQNRWFTQWVREHPDRISAFAAVSPAAGAQAVEDTRRALDAGFLGIGECLPQAQNFTFADETWHALMELAREYGVPVTIHVSDPLSTAPAGLTKETPLPPYIRLAQDFPNNTFILAHWGGGIPFYELNPRLRSLLKNIYYDTAASPLLYDKRVYRHACDLVGAERILFGSDYPLLTHPRLTRAPTFVHDLADARSSGLSDAELGAVLGENARRLLKL